MTLEDGHLQIFKAARVLADHFFDMEGDIPKDEIGDLLNDYARNKGIVLASMIRLFAEAEHACIVPPAPDLVLRDWKDSRGRLEH